MKQFHGSGFNLYWCVILQLLRTASQIFHYSIYFPCFKFLYLCVSRVRSPPRSPDSVLKLKLCPPLPFFPNSTCSQFSRSSFDKASRGEYRDQRKQLLSNSSPPPHYTLFESHLGSQALSPTALESISRGPDGRFIVQPLPQSSSPSNKKNLKTDVLLSNGSVHGSGSNRSSFRDSPKSSVRSSEKDERKESPLTVDVPELSRPPASPGRVRAMARNFSRRGCFYSDDEQGSETLLERVSFYSDNSERKNSDSLRRYCMPGHTEDLFSSLGRRTKLLDRDRSYHPEYQARQSDVTDNNSILVSQLENELERESVNKCAQSAKEREEIEQELKSYAADQRQLSRARKETHSSQTKSPQMDSSKSEGEPVWKPQDVTIRQKCRASGVTNRVSDYRRACYFGSTSSPLDRLPTARVHWDISPVTSVTRPIPVQSPHKTSSPVLSRETTEDSLAVESLQSPVTQNTSLGTLSSNVTTETSVLRLETPDRAKSPSSQKKSDICVKPSTEQSLKEKPQSAGIVLKSKHSAAHSGTQVLDSPGRRFSATDERPERSASAPSNQTGRTSEATKRDFSLSSSSNLNYRHHEVSTKTKDRETQDQEDRCSLGFYSELEREGVRAQSRRSDKCLFSDSPNPISTLTFVEEAESDQSQFSVPRMSDSFKAKPAAPSPQMSPNQTSAILEYLSLPGFIEMSVDEPVEEVPETDTTEQSSELKPEESVVAKPDVVPRNWEVHVQEKPETVSSRAQKESVAAAGSSTDASKKQGHRRSSHVETRVRFPDDARPASPGLEKTSKQLYDEKMKIRVGYNSTGRPESRLGSRSAHTLFSAAKGMADIVSKHTPSFVDKSEFSSEQPQRQASQGSRTNNIVSRISQAPVPFLKKSLSLGPCRTLSGVGQPRPYLKKSISLGSQRWEHCESPRTYISENCYWDEFPNLDVPMKSYSLGRMPSSLPRPAPCWREYVPLRRPSMGSLERPQHTQRSSYLTPTMYPPRPTSVSPMMEPPDPRQQAAFFPESSRWSPSFRDPLRSTQHQYIPVPMSTSIPLPHYQHWSEPRGESLRYVDSRRGPPRSYLPRGISWPSPYYSPFPPREEGSYRHPDRMMGRSGDYEIRDGGRTSYASQSSGRGSAGLLRQSLSVTPTLLSSPETTEELERHRAEVELPRRRVKR